MTQGGPCFFFANDANQEPRNATDKSSGPGGCGDGRPCRGSGGNESTHVPRRRPHLSRVCEYAAAVDPGQGHGIFFLFYHQAALANYMHAPESTRPFGFQAALVFYEFAARNQGPRMALQTGAGRPRLPPYCMVGRVRCPPPHDFRALLRAANWRFREHAPPPPLPEPLAPPAWSSQSAGWGGGGGAPRLAAPCWSLLFTPRRSRLLPRSRPSPRRRRRHRGRNSYPPRRPATRPPPAVLGLPLPRRRQSRSPGTRRTFRP